jgi:tetratricopeptide (TPR) repeat protein
MFDKAMHQSEHVTTPFRRVGMGLAGRLHRSAVFLLAVVLFPPQAYSSRSHLQAALEMMNQGKLEQAEHEARLALDDPASRPVAWATLGTIRLQQNRYDEGAELLRKALSLNPYLIGARISLGGVYALEGKKNQAREAFREALAADPSNLNARLDLAQLEREDGNYETSLQVAKPVVAEFERSPEGLLLLATDYSGLEQRDSLRALLPRWKALLDPPPELTTSFGVLLTHSGLAREGVEVLEKAKGSRAPSFELANALGQGYLAIGDLDRASESYEAALALKRDCVPCMMGVAAASEKQGNTEKALACLIQAKGLEPENPEVLFQFGKVCFKRDLIDDALPALEKAAFLKPDNDTYSYVLASAYVGKGTERRAVETFHKLALKHPEDAAVNYALGTALYLNEEPQEAEKYLQKSINLQPHQKMAYYYLALAAEKTDDVPRAISILRDVVGHYPDYAQAHEALGTVLLKDKQYAQAEASLRKAIQLDPNLLQAHYQLGRLLGRVGKEQESQAELEIARRLEHDQRARKAQQIHLEMPE